MSDAIGLAPEIQKQIRGYAPGDMEPDVVAKILRGYFTGQRDGVRTYTFLELQVQGNGGMFNAIAVDISRSGMLFRITDARFAAEGKSHPLMPYTARVWHNFEDGLHVLFDDAGIAVPADIVRVTGYSANEDSLILVGCRFRERLTPEECDTLGITYGDDLPPGDE